MQSFQKTIEFWLKKGYRVTIDQLPGSKHIARVMLSNDGEYAIHCTNMFGTHLPTGDNEPLKTALIKCGEKILNDRG